MNISLLISTVFDKQMNVFTIFVCKKVAKVVAKEKLPRCA
jgi:hypothetical protein